MMLCCAEQPRLKESSTCVLQMWFKSVDFIGQWLPSLSRNKCRWGKCDLWCWLQPAERHRLLCSLAWWVMTYKWRHYVFQKNWRNLKVLTKEKGLMFEKIVNLGLNIMKWTLLSNIIWYSILYYSYDSDGKKVVQKWWP